MRRHPLTRRVARALRARRLAGEAPFAALLERRLAALADLAAGRPLHPRRREALRSAPVARRLLRRLEGTWHDGDENAVRDRIGSWEERGPGAGRARARRLLALAAELARIGAPDATIFCFLSELEAALEQGMEPGRG